VASSVDSGLDLIQFGADWRSIVLTTILASVAVPDVKWVAAVIGGGLFFAALTNTCAMGKLLSKLPYNRGAACDAETVVAHLIGRGDRKVG
jgi:hypothetical protein